ncbi:hypothetical protein [Pseudoalteromonas sp. R3]|uniref:hypothetical protein n=1 Tax=Pseudoalteromonas sp. R3 TaxID=1709477 RepID=UPI0006B63D36|nr:hypothetical protein [Pseudoalteromonas sp. R3]AZZ98216.1 hypothetical protein ELR70_14490 [Pseudoalteromonas sp. R3]
MSYIQVYMLVMFCAFIVCSVVSFFKKRARRNKSEDNANEDNVQTPKCENNKPAIMLDYDESLARELEHNPLFLSVYSDCEKAQAEFFKDPGAFSALVMDIMDVVNRHAIRHREIDVNLWSGIILRKMFPERYK